MSCRIIEQVVGLFILYSRLLCHNPRSEKEEISGFCKEEFIPKAVLTRLDYFVGKFLKSSVISIFLDWC